MIGHWIRRLIPGHTTLGLEITDTHVKLCEIRESGNSVRVKQYATMELPAGTMNDGRIVDEMSLRQTLQKLVAERRWSSSFVHFAIPSQSVLVRLLKMPDVSDKDMRKIVQFEVDNHIHLPFEDPYYDFLKLQSVDDGTTEPVQAEPSPHISFQFEVAAGSENASTRDAAYDSSATCDVMLVAAPMELLRQYISIVDDLNLKLCSIEIKAFSLIRLQQRCFASSQEELTLIADVNGTNCDLTIVQHGSIQLTRNVQVSFTAHHAHSTDSLDRLFEEFISEDVNDDASFNELAGELERFMNFYRYTLNHRNQEFKRIQLSGDIPMIEQLAEYLSKRMTNIRVIPMEWSELKVEAQSGDWRLGDYAVPLGLCLRGKS